MDRGVGGGGEEGEWGGRVVGWSRGLERVPRSRDLEKSLG